jgi:Protein-tyrosine-phosphatase
MKKILIVGEDNSCRSQMAEGWMRYYTKNYAEVVSAGVSSNPVDLHAANAMSQAIIDISKQQSKLLGDVINSEYDFVLFTFVPASVESFKFSGTPKIIVQPFEKPTEGSNSKETEIRYGQVRDEIENFCFDFVHQHIRKMY